MKREQKTQVVEDLSASLRRAKMALVSEYKGMSAGQSDDLRRRLRAVRAEMRIAKNTLVRRAIKDTQFAALEDKLGGPIGLILSYDDPIEAAKAITSYKDAGDKLRLRGGVIGGKPLTPEEIQTLAMLPPREVIMAQLLGVLQAPATALVRLLNEPGSALARVVDAIGKKNGSGASSEAAPAQPADAAEEAKAE